MNRTGRSAALGAFPCRVSPVLYVLGLLMVATLWAPNVAGAARYPEAVIVAEPEDLIRQDFTRYDARYETRRHPRQQRLDALWRRVQREESEGRQMPCSSQTYMEAKWLLRSTTHWDRIDAALSRLERSIAERNQAIALAQSGDDGSWGGCTREPFLRLSLTVDALGELTDRGAAPKYRLRFLERFLSRERMLGLLEGLLVSDVGRDGVDNRDQLNAMTASYAQLLFKPELRGYIKKFANLTEAPSDLADALIAFLDEWQDPVSGYWGALYRSKGRLYRANDLSITYHVVSYRRGAVARWPQLVSTLLATRRLDYPYGWLRQGQFTHHHNYDVAKLMGYGWPYMSPDQRGIARRSLRSMVNWCLWDALTMDGSVKNKPPIYDSLADNYYFALSFLDTVGFWDAAKRFWTNDRLGATSAFCLRIKDNAVRFAAGTPMGDSALSRLPDSCAGIRE